MGSYVVSAGHIILKNNLLETYHVGQSIHFLDFLNIPYNTDIHTEEGYECFKNSIKVNPKLKHLKPYIVKHLRPAA